MALPTDAQARKNIPVYSGFIKYFPDAMIEVAKLSKVGNDQHNPGQPLHWAKEKSGDELDALVRHMIDDASGVPVDTDGIDHAVKMAWRAMANLQRLCDARKAAEAPEFEDGPEFAGWDERSKGMIAHVIELPHHGPEAFIEFLAAQERRHTFAPGGQHAQCHGNCVGCGCGSGVDIYAGVDRLYDGP